MPHLSPILWFLVMSMFLMVVLLMISSMWWMQYSQFKVKVYSLDMNEVYWKW